MIGHFPDQEEHFPDQELRSKLFSHVQRAMQIDRFKYEFVFLRLPEIGPNLNRDFPLKGPS